MSVSKALPLTLLFLHSHSGGVPFVPPGWYRRGCDVRIGKDQVTHQPCLSRDCTEQSWCPSAREPPQHLRPLLCSLALACRVFYCFELALRGLMVLCSARCCSVPSCPADPSIPGTVRPTPAVPVLHHCPRGSPRQHWLLAGTVCKSCEV